MTPGAAAGGVPYAVLANPADETFHDVEVHGIAWNGGDFTLSMACDYIVEWLAPSIAPGRYRFRVSRATALFSNVSQIRLDLDWGRSAPRAQIAELTSASTRLTRNGREQRKFVFTFEEPEGTLEFWATGVDVHLWHAPLECDLPRLPPG